MDVYPNSEDKEVGKPVGIVKLTPFLLLRLSLIADPRKEYELHEIDDGSIVSLPAADHYNNHGRENCDDSSQRQLHTQPRALRQRP